jgi:DNA-binding NarL/FixJ family response regulator
MSPAPNPDSAGRADQARPTRVLVVDDHPLTRTGISAMLRQHADLEVVAEAATADSALAAVKDELVDVVVLDLRLGRTKRDGAELAGAIWEARPETRVVLYSNYVADETAMVLEGANVFGVVLKTDHPRTLVAAVRSAARRVPFISPDASARVSQAWSRDPLARGQ